MNSPLYAFRRRRRQGPAIGSAFLATMILSTTIIAFMSSAALAKGPKDHSLLVRYDDLDLANGKDRTRLEQRIHRAAKNVCAPTGIAATFMHRKIDDCVDLTKAKALRELDRKTPILTAGNRPRN